MVPCLLKRFSNISVMTGKLLIGLLALPGPSVTFFKNRCYIKLLKDIWRFAFSYTKTEKVTNVVQRNDCILL